MVEVTISDDDKFLLFRAAGNQFTEILDSFKYAGLRYDSKTKAWIGKIGLYNYYRNYFTEYGISDDEYTKEFLKNWGRNISQLQKITRRSEYKKYNSDLMKFPAL